MRAACGRHHLVSAAAPITSSFEEAQETRLHSGGNSLKSDFGGHSNFHHDNLDLFFDKGYGITGQLPGFEDAYYGNYLYMSSDGPYGSGSPITHSNTVWSPTGAVPIARNDSGTVAMAYPKDAAVLAVAREILKLA